MAKIFYSTDKNAPAGSDKQVQFNDNGLVGAHSGLTYDKATGTLTVTQVAGNAATAATAAALSDTSYAKWTKYTIGYATAQVAALTKEVELATLGEGEVLLGVKIKHSVAFAGTSITSVTASVGISATPAKYATAFDILQAVANDTFQLSQGFFEENHAGGTSVIAKFTAVGANLSALTAGSVDIWLLVAKAY